MRHALVQVVRPVRACLLTANSTIAQALRAPSGDAAPFWRIAALSHDLEYARPWSVWASHRDDARQALILRTADPTAPLPEPDIATELVRGDHTTLAEHFDDPLVQLSLWHAPIPLRAADMLVVASPTRSDVAARAGITDDELRGLWDLSAALRATLRGCRN